MPTTITRLPSAPAAYPGAAEVVKRSVFMETLFSLLSDKLQFAHWAEGKVEKPSPLRLRDASGYRQERASIAGQSYNDGEVYLNGKPFIECDGANNAALAVNYAIPASYFFAAVFRISSAEAPSDPRRTLFGQAGSPALVVSVGNTYAQIQHGGSPLGASSALLNAPATDYVLWSSYRASDGSIAAGINAVTPQATATGYAAVPVRSVINVGGRNPGTFRGAFPFLGIAEGALHGSDVLDDLREKVLDAIADYYGITIAG